MNSLEYPVYNKLESVTKYLRKVESFKNNVLKEKYDMVIRFLNEWTNLNIKSLTDFQNMNENDLLKNQKHIHGVVRKYSEIFEKTFKIDLSVDDSTDSDDIKDKYIIFILSKVLIDLDYNLSKTQFNNKTFYAIKKK